MTDKDRELELVVFIGLIWAVFSLGGYAWAIEKPLLGPVEGLLIGAAALPAFVVLVYIYGRVGVSILRFFIQRGEIDE